MKKRIACFLAALLVLGILSNAIVADAYTIVVDDCPHENPVFTPYDGYSHRAVCGECGEEIVEPHAFTGHTCTVCGYTYIPGDLNGDESVTPDDAIYLLFHAFFPTYYPVNQPVDLNGDGGVTPDDAIYLLFHSFFPTFYPLTNS